jgi:hypothetical protein
VPSAKSAVFLGWAGILIRKALRCHDLQPFCEKSSNQQILGNKVARWRIYTLWYVRHIRHVRIGLWQFGENGLNTSKAFGVSDHALRA